MIKKPTCVRVLMMPYQDDGDKDQVGYLAIHPWIRLACKRSLVVSG
jgi:hypothetical protein